MSSYLVPTTWIESKSCVQLVQCYTLFIISPFKLSLLLFIRTRDHFVSMLFFYFWTRVFPIATSHLIVHLKKVEWECVFEKKQQFWMFLQCLSTINRCLYRYVLLMDGSDLNRHWKMKKDFGEDEDGNMNRISWWRDFFFVGLWKYFNTNIIKHHKM